MRSSGTLVIGLLMSETTVKEETLGGGSGMREGRLLRECEMTVGEEKGRGKRELKTVPGKHVCCFRS